MQTPSPRLVWLLFVSLLVGGAVYAYQVPNGPLLAGWIGVALAFGSWFAFGDKGVTWRTRMRNLTVLHCALVAATLLTTQLAARRLTSATHLRFNGVLFEQADSIVIASGLEGVDVRVPTISPTQLPWRMTMVKQGEHWYLANAADVEQVRVAPLPQPILGKRYTVLNGVVLDEIGDSVEVRDERGTQVDVLTLRDSGGVLSLHSRAYGVYATKPLNARLEARFARMLRRGTTIGSLDGARSATAPYDRFVRVQTIDATDDVNGSGTRRTSVLTSLVKSTPRFIVSSAAPFLVSDFTSRGSIASALPLGDSVRVEVRHMGGVWRFDVVTMQRDATAARGLAVIFQRNPRPLDTPLPSGDSCVPGAACGLLSLRRLPPPIAHVSLDAAGFDPTRFALLARLLESDNGVTVVLPRDSVSIPLSSSDASQFTAIPVTPTSELSALQVSRSRPGEPTSPSHWLLLSATSQLTDGMAEVIVLCLGIIALLFASSRVIERLAASQRIPALTNERALALGLNALLTLLLARLTIGARVTYFPPFSEAGVNTAIGMWVAVAVVTIGLLAWRWWAPPVLTFFHALSQLPRLRGDAIVGAFKRSFATGNDGDRSILVELAWLLLPLGLLGWASWQPVAFGVVAGVAVLLTWFVIAWIIAYSGAVFHSFASGPFEVIEFHDADSHASGTRVSRWWRALPERHLLFLAALWMLVLVSTQTMIAAVLLPIALHLFRRWKPGSRLFGDHSVATSPLLVLVGETVSVVCVAALRFFSENGAMAAFLFIILVTLVSVRAGRALAARLPRESGTARSLPWWTIALYLVVPMLLLLPLAFIDMGLLLVMSIPIGGAALLAVGLHRLTSGGKVAASAAALLMLYVLVFKVLFPDVSALRSNDPQVRAERFEEMQRFFGIRFHAAIGESFERAAARAVATRDQDAAERLLISAQPGEARDLLLPSIEQVWASKAYATSGAFGSGLGLAPIGGRGIAESVSYAENSYAVYILHEHGWLGGIAVLAAYLVFGGAVLLAVRRAAVIRTESMRATLALFLVATLVVIIPAMYVALSNLGIVPITGQNMPFLGLNAWSDVTLCAGVVGILVTGAIRTEGIRG